ncbi:transmembrane emp24 domain-containing protein 5 [Chrysoperla carnea]|uniref:transmembrane emp24 domain-containing protein 5 n=1 Tax=Chrysoperla carnea TaxID=189513 RepID=UPI001D071339|nr:transmembrane emp24 domain-containing protein 5 [Chrysoperla carnea]
MLDFREIFVILFLITSVQNVAHYYKEFTVTIEPGTDTCFYHNIKEGQRIDIEYQVIDGGHGDLDINFQLAEPSGRIIYADFKKSDNVHRADIKTTGDYKFCFDNTFSRYNSKAVFFELVIEDANAEENDKWDDNLNADFLDGLTKEEVYDMKMSDIQDVIERVRLQLIKVKHIQDLIRTHEARDRNVAEENFYRVNTWSIFQIVIMIIVGIIQVVMVKSLFDNSSYVMKILKKIKE